MRGVITPRSGRRSVGSRCARAYRPVLETLEDRLPPGGLLGWDPFLLDPVSLTVDTVRPSVPRANETATRLTVGGDPSAYPLAGTVVVERPLAPEPSRRAETPSRQNDPLEWLNAAVWSVAATRPASTRAALANGAVQNGLPGMTPNVGPHGGELRPAEQPAANADRGLAALVEQSVSVAPALTEAANDQLQQSYGKLPLSFEANYGQTDEQVRFLARGSGYNLFLTANEAVLSLYQGSEISSPGSESAVANGKSLVVHMQILGANPTPAIAGRDELPGKVNYLLGDDPSQWQTNVPNYAKVEYRNVYDGIDLVYYGTHQRQLEYDFVVAPGVDPSVIRLGFTGADRLEIDERGDLVLHSGSEQVRQHRPILYQEVNGTRQEVAGRYLLANNGEVGFEVGAHDVTKPLVIDPVLGYSSFLGGAGYDYGHSIAVDAGGSAYITGYTRSTGFPSVSGYQPDYGGGTYDAFVMKLNPSGTALVYSTFLGGRDWDAGYGIATDAYGNAYVAGVTHSNNFPTFNPLQPAFRGGASDAFVTMLDPSGALLTYSTYLGGTGIDTAYAIAVDPAGNAYVTGSTTNNTFPTASPLLTFGGGTSDAFVAKIGVSDARLVYSTFLGGTGADVAQGIAVDPVGNVHVTGYTASTTTFPLALALQPMHAGGTNDGFVTEIDAAGAALNYSTFLGGRSDDFPTSIAVDPAGNTYVTGYTASNNFPLASALQPTYRGSDDAFVTKLEVGGAALVYSTYLGGTGLDLGWDIAVDAAGNAAVSGRTVSTNFPTADPFQADYGGGLSDGFVTQLNAAGSAFIFSTYQGGAIYDGTRGIAVDLAGNIYVTGVTESADFATSAEAFDTTCGSDGTCNTVSVYDPDCFCFITTIQPDGFVTRFGDAVYVPTAAYFTVTPSAGSVTAGSAFLVTVTARDAFGGFVPTYGGTVHFTSSDGSAALPADYTFTPGDGGTYTFAVTLATAGSQTITVTDIAVPSVIGSTTVTVTVPTPTVSAFYVYAPESVTAGVPFDFWLAPLDASGGLVTTYAGTVYFAVLTDPSAMLPPEFTYTPPHEGWVLFAGGATLLTPGVHDFWAWDPVSGAYGVASVTVV